MEFTFHDLSFVVGFLTGAVIYLFWAGGRLLGRVKNLEEYLKNQRTALSGTTEDRDSTPTHDA